MWVGLIAAIVNNTQVTIFLLTINKMAIAKIKAIQMIIVITIKSITTAAVLANNSLISSKGLLLI